MRYLFLSGLVFFSFLACNDEEVFNPKPRMFPKVHFPEKQYENFDIKECPFQFQKPTYTTVERISSQVAERIGSDCWFDVYYPNYDARVHFTYFPVNNNYDSLLNATYELVSAVNERSSAMEETAITSPEKGGVIFDIKGPAASPAQFFLTDTINHFLRGALYFNTQSRPDSLAPVTRYIQDDIEVMIASLRWKEE